MSTAPITCTWWQAESLDLTETILIRDWSADLAHGHTPEFVAACIEAAVHYDPRLGLPMDVCDRHGCSVLVDENARDATGLHCSTGCRDAASWDADARRTARLLADGAWVA